VGGHAQARGSFILGIVTTVANAMALGIAFVVCSYAR